MDMVKIRDLVVEDAIALQKWHRIADHIVKSADDVLTIKKMIRNCDFAEAVLRSLQLWYSGGGNSGDLLQALRNHGLNVLADGIEELEFGSTSKGWIWFEIGELPHNFTGRKKELEALDKMIKASRAAGSITGNVICIVGLGGVGKSTLARKYAFDYAEDYDKNVILITAESPDSMRNSFMRLAKQLRLRVEDQTPNEELLAKVYDKFSGKKCLFIFDNVEDKQHFKQFRPKVTSPSGSTTLYVLITSRRSDIIPVPKNYMKLDVLKLEEAVELVLAGVPQASQDDAAKLAEKLQRLPLALQQAIAFIMDTYLEDDDECIVTYLEEYNKQATSLLADERFQEDLDYSRTTLTTWNVTVKRILQLDGGKAAIFVLHTLSYLNPDLISKQFARIVFEDLTDPTLKLLVRFSMISLSLGRLVIHRLVQQVIQLNATPEMEKMVGQLLCGKLQNILHTNELNDFVRECTSHGLHLFPFQAKHPELITGTGYPEYLSKLCYQLSQYGNFADCLHVAAQAVVLLQSSMTMTLTETTGNGNDRRGFIELRLRAADAQFRLDNNSEAREILNSILPAAKASLGEEDWLTQSILAALAINYSETEEHEKAVEIYDQIIGLRVRVHGPDDGTALSFRHNKANALFRMNKLSEADELFQVVWEKRLALYGPKDLRSIASRNGVAKAALALGQTEKALSIWRDVYEDYKELVGEEHVGVVEMKERIEEVEKDQINE